MSRGRCPSTSADEADSRIYKGYGGVIKASCQRYARLRHALGRLSDHESHVAGVMLELRAKDSVP